MKCSDLSDVSILEFLAKHQGRWSTWGAWAGNMPTVADAMPPETPEKLQRAKMNQLMKRGLVRGCSCGCRGDYENEITPKGLTFLRGS